MDANRRKNKDEPQMDQPSREAMAGKLQIYADEMQLLLDLVEIDIINAETPEARIDRMPGALLMAG